MRVIGLLLSFFTILCVSHVSSAYTFEVSDPSFLEWSFRRSSKKSKDKIVKVSSKSGGVKKRGIRSRLRGKGKKDDSGDLASDKKKPRKGFGLFKRSKSQKSDDVSGSGKGSWFSRRRGGRGNRNEPHHERHHKELTDDLMHQIETDQKEPSIGDVVMGGLTSMTSDIKQHLLTSISNDIDSALNKMNHAQ
ncbi:uncharacterized protein BXIN_0572 [Babesia sp. Xinjiang]|uniref:uncharacterized protein n=1 Tax=Babesia sp. Xinjiang TaxID=462227 RepID=UPI000A240E62|nr:uncharacterized protein BXIN_0572 [Babesia sp. Xinjiang]ORM41850.1 hypothetical protein BXIN_0572 [Babesia sp. Xinjiang]